MNEQKKSFSNRKTIFFVAILCLICGLILSSLSILLRKPQLDAEKLFNSKQLLLSARILDPAGGFILQGHEGHFQDALYNSKTGKLDISTSFHKAKPQDILDLYQLRILPRLTDDKGHLLTFEDVGIDYNTYLNEHSKQGYYNLPYKLLYLILPNLDKRSLIKTQDLYGYVFPINGFGLWDAIYGYLCVGPDANTVIGVSWYNQKETPGLGAEISSFAWQKQFYGKKIFKVGSDGKTNFEKAPLGVRVLKTNVETELGHSQESLNAVDGIAGATITSNGVTESYRQSLSPYRAFLLNAHHQWIKTSSAEKQNTREASS